MADSHHYQTGTILYGDFNGKGGEAWDLITKIQTFLNDTVANGWSAEYYTGRDADDTSEYEDYLFFDNYYDPAQLQAAHIAGDHVHGTTGLCPYFAGNEPWGGYSGNNPDKKQAKCRSAYFKYSDGQERDSHFFISIINDPVFEQEFYGDAFHVGAFHQPPTDNMHLGGFLNNGTPIAHNSGEFNVSPCIPADSPPIPDYGTNECIGLTPTISDSPFNLNPWNYRTQAGYNGEVKTNYLLPHHIGPDWIKYHFFGGVENGAPYFYCVLEGLAEDNTALGRQRSFSHFNFGRVAKIGDYDGGEFYQGQDWNTSAGQIAAPGAQYHSDIWDSTSTRYAATRSSLLFSKYRTTYDEGDPNTWLTRYLFGYNYNNYLYRCYADGYGGLYTGPWNDGGKSTFTKNVELWPNNVRVYDAERDDGTYMIVGQAPAFRSLKIPHIQPERQVTDRHGHTWMVFPVRGKYNDSSAKPSSGDYGYAYRIS